MIALDERDQNLLRAVLYGNAAVAVTGCGGLIAPGELLPVAAGYTAVCLGAAALASLAPALFPPATAEPYPTLAFETAAATVALPPASPFERVGPLIAVHRLNDTLYYTIRRHFDGQPASRRAMQAAGFDQRYWSLANACLQALGVLDGKAWKVDSSRAAFQALNRLTVTENDVTTRASNGVLVRLDLKAAHFIR